MSTPGPGWPLRRIVLLPAVLLVAVSGATFTLAELHLARPDEPGVAAVRKGDPARGRVVFVEKCAPCHGPTARGGVGPRLAGTQLSLAAAKFQIDNGGGIMPPRLVSGKAEEDVLAYLDTVLAP